MPLLQGFLPLLSTIALKIAPIIQNFKKNRPFRLENLIYLEWIVRFLPLGPRWGIFFPGARGGGEKRVSSPGRRGPSGARTVLVLVTPSRFPSIHISSRDTRFHRIAQGQLAVARLAFMGQQPFFAVDAAAKARQGTVGTDHPMTGDDDGNGIAAIRETHGARSIGIVQTFGERTVPARFAARTFVQLAPDPLLKLGAVHAQWQIELAAFTGEIFFQLTRGGGQGTDRRILHPIIADGGQLARLVAI